MKNKGPILLIIIIVMLCCCAIVFFAGFMTWMAMARNTATGLNSTTTQPLPVNPVDNGEDAQPLNPIKPSPVLVEGETSREAAETLETLKKALVPINDLRDLAMRLEGKTNIPETLEGLPKEYAIGDQEKFWVTNTDTNINFQVNAILQYKTEHVYFWIEKGVTFDPRDVANLVETFENQTYPKNREFFGEEWTPGIDNDPHLYILYARGGGQVGGYFSSADSVHPLAHKYSNGHESFFISADYVYLGDPSASGTLAHEFQHMIHWNLDRNEESWLNEGFSVLAEFLNGYDPGWVDDEYLANTDIQLTYWPSGEESYPHYGAAFLFVNYFLDRFGEEATQALVANPDNGMDSVDAVLKEIDAIDGQTGKLIGADDVFTDWVVANFLNSEKVGDGRYVYRLYQDVPRLAVTEAFNRCPTTWEGGDVNQYGVDYIYIRGCTGELTVEFTGSSEVKVVPRDPHSGKYMFWSNKGDESDMTLTRSFDFTDHEGSITLNYWTWYDLEKDYDYLYLLASLDGKNWEIITTPSCTSEDPSGNSYGCGYNGATGVWINETVDLTKYAGQKIQLRFEYVTDAAVNGEGLLLDDISIPEIGYFSDFETDEGGWEGAGFVRIQNTLPQTFRVSLIRNTAVPMVSSYEVLAGETLLIPDVMNGESADLVLVVSGTTRFTHQPANYQYFIKTP